MGSGSGEGIKDEVEKANRLAVERMMEAEPVWVDIGLARDKLGLEDYTLLHAGPPVAWDRASGPVKGALIGAVIYEGWASTSEEAEKLLSSGEVKIEPTHSRNAVGPMAGVISPSMPVYEVYDKRWGNRAYSNLNEGIGKVLRYGAYSGEVLERLRWMSETLYPALKQVIDQLRGEKKEGLQLKAIISQALQMGDDCHNRCVAATNLLLKEITPYLLESDVGKKEAREAFSFMSANPFTSLNLVMAAGKVMTLAAHNIEYSTLVTVMARNGAESGIWVSSLGGRWFSAPAPVPRGVYFPGYGEKDASGDLGDSAITETAGYGGFAMATAPAIVSWVGGSVKLAVETTQKMYEITYTKHRYFQIPYLNFQGTPTGIDVRKVLKTGIAPIINTGIAHREAGVGQIGAGIVQFPIEIFKKAFRAFVDKYGV